MMKIRVCRARNAICAGVIVLGALLCGGARAFEGDLDPAFADNGRVYLGWAVDSGVVRNDVPVSILGSSDGGAILVGNVTDAGLLYSGKNAIGIAKLTSKGQFDASFGDAATPGQTKIHGGGTSFFLPQIRANGATLQLDGKILIVGNSAYPASGKRIVSVWRLNTDGSPDGNFGSGGEVDIDNGFSDESDSGNAITVMQGIDPNSGYSIDEGRIVIAGMRQFNPGLVVGQAWLRALNPDGSLVGAYGENIFDAAVICDPVNAYHDYALSAVRFLYNIEQDMITLYATGNCIPRPSSGGLYYPFLIKVDNILQASDLNWGNSGQAGMSEIFNAGGGNVSYANSIVTGLDAEQNGEVVFAGYYDVGDGTYGALYGAVKPDGALDQTWMNGGVTAHKRSAEFSANAIMFDPSEGAYVEPIIAGHQQFLTCPPPPEVCGGLGEPWWAAKIDQGVIQSSPSFCGGGPYAFPVSYICFYTTNASNISAGGITSMAYTPGRRILLGGYVTFSDGSTDFQVQRLIGDEIFGNGFGYPSSNYR